MRSYQKSDSLKHFQNLSQKYDNPFLEGKQILDDVRNVLKNSSNTLLKDNAIKRGSITHNKKDLNTSNILKKNALEDQISTNQISKDFLSKVSFKEENINTNSHKNQIPARYGSNKINIQRGSASMSYLQNKHSQIDSTTSHQALRRGSAPVLGIQNKDLKSRVSNHDSQKLSQARRSSTSQISKSKILQKSNIVEIDPLNDIDALDDENEFSNEKNPINDHLINVLNNENFDLYSKNCLDKLRMQREESLKKSNTKNNEVFIRNQYVKKQLDNIRAMKLREELSDFGKYLSEPNVPEFDHSDQVKLAGAVFEHQLHINDFSEKNIHKWENRRALKATLLQSKLATDEYEKEFGKIETKNHPLDGYSVREETEKLLLRTKLLLDELDEN